MRTTAYCTLDYATLVKMSNYLQVTTSNNETLIFDFNKKVPALAKYITNSQELCNAEKYVGPGFTATAVQQVETQNKNAEAISLQVWSRLVPNSQRSVLVCTQEIF